MVCKSRSSMQEGKVYSIGKRKLFELKNKVSVLLPGLMIECSNLYPGSASDLTIHQEKGEFHGESLRKSISGEKREDLGELSEENTQLRADLADM